MLRDWRARPTRRYHINDGGQIAGTSFAYTSGWDPRPWNENEPTTGDLMWYIRSPEEVRAFVADGMVWTASNPTQAGAGADTTACSHRSME